MNECFAKHASHMDCGCGMVGPVRSSVFRFAYLKSMTISSLSFPGSYTTIFVSDYTQSRAISNLVRLNNLIYSQAHDSEYLLIHFKKCYSFVV